MRRANTVLPILGEPYLNLIRRNLMRGTMETGRNRITGATFPFIAISSMHASTFVSPQFRSSVPCHELEEIAMMKLLVAALIAGSFISAEARAQDRAGDAALGAVSGAVVLGPVGAVAGALIGYTAGPSIAHSWGVGRSASRSHARRTAHLAKSDPRSVKQNPGIQSDVTQNTSIQGTGEQAATKASSPAPVESPKTPPGVAPPVQGFE